MNGKKPKKYTKKGGNKSKAPKSTNSRAGRDSKPTFITSKCKEIGKRDVRVQRGAEIFPRNWFVQFKYVESSYIDCTASGGLSAIGYQYSTNNSYDPRYSLGGGQPLWYDQVAPYYERLWDHAAKVELTFTNPGIDGMYCGYRVRPITDGIPTAGQSLDYLQQMDLTEIKPVNNTGAQVVKFAFFVKNYKVFGISKDVYQDLTYSHVNNNNPSVFTLLEPFAFSTTSDSSIRYDLKITFFTELTNRITAAQS